MLCGLRDIRDYKAASGGDPSRLGTASPFNIAVESLRIGDFTADEVAVLCQQHTAETGQEFTHEATERVFALTQGQPWLVNALAREVTQKMRTQPPDPVTTDHIEAAKERLILARATQREAVELKVWHPRQADPLTKGLAQLDGYLDRLGLDTGTLIVFDRRPDALPVTERTAITQIGSPAGRAITLLRA